MLKTNIIGNNAVGRMYRPKRIISSGERGYILQTKYKSNYGGSIKLLNLTINLETNYKDKSEIIRISTESESNTKNAVNSEKYYILNKNEVKSRTDDVVITTVRKILKPNSYYHMKKDIPIVIKYMDGVIYIDLFIDSDIETEQEIVNLAFYPSIINDEEFIVIDTDSRTPIIIENENGVFLA